MLPMRTRRYPRYKPKKDSSGPLVGALVFLLACLTGSGYILSEASTAGERAPVAPCDPGPQRVEVLSVARAVVVDDWAAHVQANADLLSGKNTEAETKAIWGTTRERGPARADSYEDARKAYEAACGGPKECPALEAADAAVADWRTHLKAMADRRAGNLDPTHAQHMWQKAYEKAPDNIAKFREAAAKGCPA